MPGLKKLKENIGRRWSLCSQNATQINFPRALLDTCPFCIESFYIEKKCIFTFLSSSEDKNIKKTNLCRIMFNWWIYYLTITHFFYTDNLCVYTERPKMKRLQRTKKAVDVYVCPPLSSSLNIFDNNAALLKCQYSYITLLIFPSTIIWRWRLVDHLHFVPGLSTIHSGDMRYNLFWIMHPTT